MKSYMHKLWVLFFLAESPHHLYYINKHVHHLFYCVFHQDLDVCECGLTDLQFSASFSLTVTKDTSITAFIGYFDIFFHKYCSQKVGAILEIANAFANGLWTANIELVFLKSQCNDI